MPSPTNEQLRAGKQDVDAHYLDATIPSIATSLGGTMLYARVDLQLGAVAALDPSQHEPSDYCSR